MNERQGIIFVTVVSGVLLFGIGVAWNLSASGWATDVDSIYEAFRAGVLTVFLMAGMLGCLWGAGMAAFVAEVKVRAGNVENTRRRLLAAIASGIVFLLTLMGLCLILFTIVGDVPTLPIFGE